MARGRPPSTDRRKSFGVRFSLAEMTAIRTRATEAGLTINGLIRGAALGRQLVVNQH
jgi:hypothetical protein